jgi:hypothetical protein
LRKLYAMPVTAGLALLAFNNQEPVKETETVAISV